MNLLSKRPTARLFAVHDDHGKISMLLTSPSNAPFGEPVVEPGQIKTEVDPSAVGFDLGELTTVELLTEIIDSHRVERGKEPEALGRLTRPTAR